MAAYRLSSRLVLSVLDNIPDNEAEWTVRTNRQERRVVLDELFIMVTAIASTASFDERDIDRWASTPPREFVATVVKNASGNGMTPATRALRSVMLLHELISVQCEIAAALAEFVAFGLTSVVEDGQTTAETPHEMVYGIDGANAMVSRLMDKVIAPGFVAPFDWATRLNELSLGQRRAVIAVASLVQPNSVGTFAAAEVLDLAVGPLMESDVHTAALVDALAEIGSLFRARFEPVESPATVHAVELAELAAARPLKMWELRDEILDTPDAGVVLDLVDAQVKLAVAALTTRAGFDGVSTDEILFGLVSKWAEQLPAPPGFSEREQPPAPWTGDDGLGSGVTGRALRLVDAYVFGDNERFFHLARPLLANAAAQGELVNVLLGLVERTTPAPPDVVIGGVTVDLAAQITKHNRVLVLEVVHPDGRFGFIETLASLCGVITTSVRSEADRLEIPVGHVIAKLAQQ